MDNNKLLKSENETNNRAVDNEYIGYDDGRAAEFATEEKNKNSKRDKKPALKKEEKPTPKSKNKKAFKKEQRDIKQRAKDKKLRRNFKKLTALSVVLFIIATVSVIVSLAFASINLSSEGSYDFLRARYHLTMIFTLLASLIFYIPSVAASSICLYDQYKNNKGNEKGKKAFLWSLTVIPSVIALILIIMIIAI